MTRPEDIYPALSEAYNAGDLETLVSLYDPQAVFVIKPGRVTKSPAELRGAMQHLVALRGRLSVNPRTFIRSDDLVLVLGTFTLSGHRGDGTPFERTSRFADVLRRQPDGRARLWGGANEACATCLRGQRSPPEAEVARNLCDVRLGHYKTDIV